MKKEALPTEQEKEDVLSVAYCHPRETLPGCSRTELWRHCFQCRQYKTPRRMRWEGRVSFAPLLIERPSMGLR
jgi:hypothetical protein